MFSQLWIRINIVHRFHVNSWRAVGKAFHAFFFSRVHLSGSLACIAFKTHLQALIQISHWLWNFWKTSHIKILRQPTSILFFEETSADKFQSSLSATTFEDPWSESVLPTLAFSPLELSLFFLGQFQLIWHADFLGRPWGCGCSSSRQSMRSWGCRHRQGLHPSIFFSPKLGQIKRSRHGCWTWRQILCQGMHPCIFLFPKFFQVKRRQNRSRRENDTNRSRIRWEGRGIARSDDSGGLRVPA